MREGFEFFWVCWDFDQSEVTFDTDDHLDSKAVRGG